MDTLDDTVPGKSIFQMDFLRRINSVVTHHKTTVCMALAKMWGGGCAGSLCKKRIKKKTKEREIRVGWG